MSTLPTTYTPTVLDMQVAWRRMATEEYGVTPDEADDEFMNFVQSMYSEATSYIKEVQSRQS